ncbi:phosphotransferase [Actinokineospora sp.]|uniref:phosphotransferase n=1 Tax=Actinokineospora sp. TaxID=1872133 RepID=UPI003D6C3E61
MNGPLYDVLTAAGEIAGIDTAGAALIRDGGNVIYRLAGGVVARIGREGGEHAAATGVHAARWLAAHDVRVVTPLPGLDQPTVVDRWPVTWWVQLAAHRHATPDELGATLRQVHSVDPATPNCADELDPFDGITYRIANAPQLAAEDHHWLTEHLSLLRADYAALPPGLSRRMIHGDAWQGNVVVPDGGEPTVLDLDHASLGPPEWDLVPLAVDHTDFARISAADYQSFVDAYGHDVTTWPGYRTLAAIRELGWTAFALSKAGACRAAATEAHHRIACLRGQVPRPWTWAAL